MGFIPGRALPIGRMAIIQAFSAPMQSATFMVKPWVVDERSALQAQFSRVTNEVALARAPHFSDEVPTSLTDELIGVTSRGC